MEFTDDARAVEFFSYNPGNPKGMFTATMQTFFFLYFIVSKKRVETVYLPSM